MRKRVALREEVKEANCEHLKQLVEQITPKIEDELISAIFYYSSNAQYVPGTLKIISIDLIEAARYKMTYSFSWRVFNACLDIDSDEKFIDKVNFEVAPGALVFDFIGDELAGDSEEMG